MSAVQRLLSDVAMDLETGRMVGCEILAAPIRVDRPPADL
jgi:hypothetical protein